jgi:glycosyltransferase involved in cell wall biosynthesis
MVSGAAVVVEKLAIEMAGRGHQVLVIAASEKDHPYIVQKENLTVVRLASIHNPYRVGQRFLLNPGPAAFKALTGFRPDIIHAHEPLHLGWTGVRYAQKTGVPITLTVHQLPWFVTKYLPAGTGPWIEHVLWKYACWSLIRFTQIIAPSSTVAGIIKSKTGIKPETIGYGFDPEVFHPCNSEEGERSALRARLDLPKGSPILLHVGRLDTDKSVDRVIIAATEVIRNTDAHLLVVGDGSQKDALIDLCRSLGIEKHVHFPGYISVEEGLAEIYRMAGLFVTASEIETQGIVLLEAMASGLPIVAVNATCIPEVVHDGHNGYLVKSGDVREMTDAIYRLLNDPALAGWMSREGIRLAKAHGSRAFIDQHERLYRLMSEQRNINIFLSPDGDWLRRLMVRVIFRSTRLFGR